MQIIENRNWQGQLCNGLIPLNLCTPSSVRLDCHIIRPVYRRRAFIYTIWCIASPAFSGTSPSPSQSIAHFWCQFLHLVFASHGAVFLGIWCFDAADTLLAVCYLSTTTGNKPFPENLPISLVWFLLSQFPCLVSSYLVSGLDDKTQIQSRSKESTRASDDDHFWLGLHTGCLRKKCVLEILSGV